MSVPRQSSILQSTEFQRSEARATRLQSRSLQKPTPELHILGEICGGTGFGEGVHVACKWALEAGDKFELIEGSIGGQTQVDCGESGSDAVVWSHPIDAHYMAGALQVRAAKSLVHGGSGVETVARPFLFIFTPSPLLTPSPSFTFFSFF